MTKEIATLSQRIGAFVAGLSLETLPAEVTEKARVCLLNGYGIGLGCHSTPYAGVARHAALGFDGERPDGATLLGDGRKVAVNAAAVANSALFHGRAQEDTCGAAHLGAIMIPLLTALLEAKKLPTERLIPALVAGYEAGGLLEKAFSPVTTPRGLRSSPLYGTIAAAAASARSMGLDAAKTAAAIDYAASFTGGILQSFSEGTDEWRYQVGVAGQTGLTATLLAANGAVSAPHSLEGRFGFARAFAGADCDVEDLAGRLGRHWAIRRVTFKPYPVCAFNQTPVIAALALKQKVGQREFSRIKVRMNPLETGYAGMDSSGPFHTVSGTLMSIPFCIALTLVRGEPTLKMMTTYDDETVNALMSNVELVPDQGVARLCCTIEAELADGKRIDIEQVMTTENFNYDRSTVSQLVRRIGVEQDVPAKAYDLIEDFAFGLPGKGVEQVLTAFGLCPRPA
ncbi:MmgE/PrpD family protein [Mesorhizobium sp. KR9-304]|uniref:MmgE/PrpD family protein n=1 Tax=Mesorhizobium sp. KR9-304 TaxID=3156614 RepID=UPI0032B437EF